MRSNVARSRRTGAIALGLMAAVTVSACGSSSNGSSTSTIATLTSDQLRPAADRPEHDHHHGAARRRSGDHGREHVHHPVRRLSVDDRPPVQGPAHRSARAQRLDARRSAGHQLPGRRHPDQDPRRRHHARDEHGDDGRAGRRDGDRHHHDGRRRSARHQHHRRRRCRGDTTTVAGGGDNCTAGSYTITADDTTRIKVADKFNVTVDQLDAANSGTNGYSAFYPGLKIVIPAKAGC